MRLVPRLLMGWGLGATAVAVAQDVTYGPPREIVEQIWTSLFATPGMVAGALFGMGVGSLATIQYLRGTEAAEVARRNAKLDQIDADLAAAKLQLAQLTQAQLAMQNDVARLLERMDDIPLSVSNIAGRLQGMEERLRDIDERSRSARRGEV